MARGEWFVSKKELCERMCISEDFFDTHFLKDPRMKVIEIRRKKLWWETDKAEIVAKEIMYELSN